MMQAARKQACFVFQSPDVMFDVLLQSQLKHRPHSKGSNVNMSDVGD